MREHLKFGGAALAAAFATVSIVVACKGDDPAAPAPTDPPSTLYVAQLSSANEVPPVGVAATGTAIFELTGKTIR
jgi:hypothetical protein